LFGDETPWDSNIIVNMAMYTYIGLVAFLFVFYSEEPLFSYFTITFEEDVPLLYRIWFWIYLGFGFINQIVLYLCQQFNSKAVSALGHTLTLPLFIIHFANNKPADVDDEGTYVAT
jgi:hypothetical protein